MRTRRCGALIGCGLLLLCTGCVGLPKRAQIPLGEWSGQGMFVASSWSVDDQRKRKALPAAQDHGSYPALLKIQSVKVDGEDAIRLEILSERGEMEPWPNLGDRTHLVAVLKRTDSVADGAIALYHVVESGLSTTGEDPRMDPGIEGVSLASCMAVDGELVLRILYQDGFLDVIRFRGDRVYKDGAYFDLSSGFVQWSEVLR